MLSAMARGRVFPIWLHGMTVTVQKSDMTKQSVTGFFDRLALYWDKDLVLDDAKIRFILDNAGVKRGSRVLDVACGTGVLFPFYARREVANVTAVDISSKMIKIASGKISGDSRFEVLFGDIEALQTTGDYDCCVIYNAFPHFPEPDRLINGIAAWLKANGRLTVAHSMSIEQLNNHHSGSASKVSRGMITSEVMIELFGERFHVDVAISDDEKYVVSGTLLPSGKDEQLYTICRRKNP